MSKTDLFFLKAGCIVNVTIDWRDSCMKDNIFKIALTISVSFLSLMMLIDSYMSHDKEYLRPFSYALILLHIFFLIITKIAEEKGHHHN